MPSLWCVSTQILSANDLEETMEFYGFVVQSLYSFSGDRRVAILICVWGAQDRFYTWWCCWTRFDWQQWCRWTVDTFILCFQIRVPFIGLRGRLLVNLYLENVSTWKSRIYSWGRISHNIPTRSSDQELKQSRSMFLKIQMSHGGNLIDKIRTRGRVSSGHKLCYVLLRYLFMF